MSFLIIWVYGVISTWKEGKMTIKSVTSRSVFYVTLLRRELEPLRQRDYDRA